MSISSYVLKRPGLLKAVRLIMHIPAGVITCLAYYLHWSLVLACLVSFMIYEINEDRHLHDRAYLDIIGFIFGLYGAVVVIWVIG